MKFKKIRLLTNFVMLLFCTGVAKKRATPTMLLSLIMVSLGLISIDPLEPTT